jgi:hypothetical protein
LKCQPKMNSLGLTMLRVSTAAQFGPGRFADLSP